MAGIGNHYAQIERDYMTDLDTIHKTATAQLVTDANRSREDGGLTPIDTGHLIESVDVNGTRGRYNWIRGLRNTRKLGDIIVLWTARYSGYVDGGTRFQRPQPFVRANVMRWNRIVREAVRRVR